MFAPTQTGPLFRVPASGGEPVAVTKLGPGQAAHGFPLFLPGGRQFLFYVAGTGDVRGIYLGSLDSPDTTRLTDADTRRRLCAIRLAAVCASGSPRGPPVRSGTSGDQR